jgi:hypothetical protein
MPESVNDTVPTDPEIPRLLDVRSKLNELATAKEDPMRTNPTATKTDLAAYARTDNLPHEMAGHALTSSVHEKDRSDVQNHNFNCFAVSR